MTLLDALAAIRDADDRGARTLAPAWDVVSRALRRFRGTYSEDAHQDALIKTFRCVGRFAAGTESGAHAWLRSVLVSASHDEHRKARRMHDALAAPTWVDQGDWVDTMPAPAAEPDRVPEIDAIICTVVAIVYAREVLYSNGRRHARRARQFAGNAELALLLHFYGVGAAEMSRAFGVAVPTIHQRTRRGRELVISALDGWDHAAAEPLRACLEARRSPDRGRKVA